MSTLNTNFFLFKCFILCDIIYIVDEDGRTMYKIPKNNLQGFDGHQVSLNMQKAELERFKGCKSEAFREVKNNNIST